MHEHELQFHIKCKVSDVGRYCFLPGDPGRCEKIAAYFDNPVKVQSNREYTTYTGTLLGEKVSVCSTGIGGPSAVIAMEELHNIGADTFIRVGTCGGIALPVKSDDVVIATGAVRHEGPAGSTPPSSSPPCPTMRCRVPWCRLPKTWASPGTLKRGAVQGFLLWTARPQADASEPGAALQVGGVEAPGCPGLRDGVRRPVLLCRRPGVRCGSCFHVIWNQEREAAGLDQEESHDLSAALEVGIEAVRLLIEADRAAKG
ncbi:uridine phosphorylase [Flavonifractor plautii]|nr:uridine phosphorylase [Flavonifractor plautii]